MGCCLDKKKYEFDNLFDGFWNSLQITKMTPKYYINMLIKNNKDLFKNKDLSVKNLKEKLFKDILNLDSEKKSLYYHETVKLVENYLDISENKQYTILISLMFFTKYGTIDNLDNSIHELFQQLSLPEYFGRGFENFYDIDFNFFKSILINFYKLCSICTFEILDKSNDEDLNNNRELINKSFTDHMIETRLIEEIRLDENRGDFIKFLKKYPQLLNPKEIRMKLYELAQDNQQRGMSCN